MNNDGTVTEAVTNSSTQFELTDSFQRTAKANFQGHKIPIIHTLRRPTLDELVARDKNNPYRSQALSEKEDRILSDFSGKFDSNLYDKLVLSTNGYAKDVEVGQTDEQRKAALSGIPPQHKTSIVLACLANKSESVYSDENEEVEGLKFSWGENQTYRVRTEIGDTGNFVAYSTLREPSQKQIDTYTNSSVFSLEKGQKKPITKITASLETVVQLYDELVQSVEGLSVNGEDVDVKNSKHLSLIDPYIKRSVVDEVMKETKLDLGE